MVLLYRVKTVTDRRRHAAYHNKIMFKRRRSLSDASRWLTVYVRINKISELCRWVVKIKKLNFKLYRAMLLLSFYIIITKQLTSSVTWLFDSRATFYGWSIVTMRLSCTVMDIWRLKRWTHERSGDFILCPMLCIALDKQQALLTSFIRVLT